MHLIAGPYFVLPTTMMQITPPTVIQPKRSRSSEKEVNRSSTVIYILMNIDINYANY